MNKINFCFKKILGALFFIFFVAFSFSTSVYGAQEKESADYPLYLNYFFSISKKGWQKEIPLPTPVKPEEKIAYIKVSISEQKTYLYDRNDRLIKWSYCVTGKSGWATRTGTFQIYRKKLHHIMRMRGRDNYDLYCKYWMPFDGGIGLHDAWWRSNFRVNNWVYGSHGCVNLPVSFAQYVFEHAQVGTPVIVYY